MVGSEGFKRRSRLERKGRKSRLVFCVGVEAHQFADCRQVF